MKTKWQKGVSAAKRWRVGEVGGYTSLCICEKKDKWYEEGARLDERHRLLNKSMGLQKAAGDVSLSDWITSIYLIHLLFKSKYCFR